MNVDGDLTIDTIILRTDAALSAEVGDEVVMLLPERNAYYDTNAHGAAVWQALASPTSVREICEGLVARYDVSFDDCVRDVLAFIQECYSEGLIQSQSGQS